MTGEQPSAAQVRDFWWRRVTLYLTYYPLFGTIALLLVLVVGTFTQGPGGLPLIVLLPLSLAVGVIAGMLTSIAPAFLSGLLAAGLHRDGEPMWRSLIIGAVAGALASELFPALLVLWLGFDRVDAMMDSSDGGKKLLWFSPAIGAFSGLCSGLIQRGRV